MIEETGLDLTRGKTQVEIIWTQFDTKMAKLLSESGGKHCQLCNREAHANNGLQTRSFYLPDGP